MRRMKWGIGAAGVVGVAWLLVNVFNLDLGGVGGGGDERLGLPEPATQSAPVHDSVPAEPPVQSEPETGLVSTDNPAQAVGSGGVVEVLVDDRTYSLRHGTGAEAEWIAAEPEAVVAYARQAEGSESGVRVRILRTPSARATAEERLIESLRDAGIAMNEIDVPEKLVE